MRPELVDNRARKVGDFLKREIHPGSTLSVVPAYFTIYGCGALRERPDEVGRACSEWIEKSVDI
ncbi:MAG: hypothetical protein OXQ94_10940 [Gemmatimonadota bacterium]|nr:hypothetical protein [Gemmatimonadota bacterium]MDE2872184.1 hypothetical protein [Gemmatimonadota bacterium]